MARFTKEEIRRAMLLYAVTDRYWLKEGETLYEKTEEAIRGGATFVQLREKKAGKDEIISLGKGLKEFFEANDVAKENVNIKLDNN